MIKASNNEYLTHRIGMVSKMKEKKIKKVSVIITTYNSSSTIMECLESVLNQNYPNYEIIVTDGGSTDGTIEILSEYPIKYEINKDLNTPASGRNRAVELSSGEILVFIDSDCIAKDENWITVLVRHIKEGIGSVGGPNITPPTDTFFARATGRLLTSFIGGFGARNPAVYNTIKEVEHNPPCNAAVPKNIFRELKGFNSNLKVAEDLDFDYRLKKKGYKLLYTPDAIVYHKRRTSFVKFIKQMYQYGFWRAVIGKKYPELTKIYHHVPTISVFLFLILIISGIFISVLHKFLIFFIVLYFLICFYSSILKFLNTKDPSSFLISILAPIEHFSYGFGFLLGKIAGERP